jgi:hypothetical protein
MAKDYSNEPLGELLAELDKHEEARAGAPLTQLDYDFFEQLGERAFEALTKHLIERVQA